MQDIFKLCKKVASYHANYNLIIKNGGHRAHFLSYKRLKLTLRVFLVDHNVAMVTYFATKLTATCSPMIGQFVGALMLASTSIEWL